MNDFVRLFQLTALALALALTGGCSSDAHGASEPRVQASEPATPKAQEPPPPDPYENFPLHGRVTGTALTIRKEPAPEAIPLGWLRRGELIRLKPSSTTSPTCSSGWHELHPRGYVCAGEGVTLSEAAPQVAEEDRSEAKRDQPLPYRYYFVRESKVPEYHQPPSRDQQRAVEAYVDAWRALELEAIEARGQKTEKAKAKKLAQFLEGKLPDQPTKHAIVRRFLEKGFFIASTGGVTRSQRNFVRSVRGSFVKEQQLEPKTGASFQGVELKDGRGLPVVWAVRRSIPQITDTRSDGSLRLVDAPDATPIERLSVVTNWKGWTHLGNKRVHELADGTYLHDWFLAVAQKAQRPKEVKANEPWVHVKLSQQTLVLYVGDEPIYATLVSTGLPEHETKVGSFRIHKKYVSNGMSDIGADVVDDRYSIDDVPWTQYFDGPRALHGAFWHAQFGIKRSHGCVNLSPADARYIFQHTWPELPAGWHGISTQQTGFTGTLVVVEE
jgi:hypothetical protein